ncbi:PiggyBac transposable element-derived protein 1 [Biomphalaria pfeifferi]|uniref:PiggyBac transposable element-derived protein 1 n=1 Tax=Biomphalaria pfeifferi TaxID=112525 RepID=A0AAD8C3Z3_BIOPF|nr:PiggyBac transposable element-derived protein 1 [Biomphalaria pfeifferi]
MTSSPDLDSFISTFANDAEKGTVRNGYALFLYQRNESDLKVTATQIDQLLQKTDSSYTSKQLTVLQNLKYMMNQINSWKRRLSSNWMRIQDLLERPVQVPRSRKKQMPSTSLAETEDVLEDVEHAQEISTPVQKLRNDCERCETTRKEWIDKKELKNVKDQVNRMVAKLRMLEEQRKDFELDTTRPEDVEKNVECLKKPTMFDPSTRKCIYSCILHQVPFEKTCSLIKFIVHELTGISFTALPCTGTISNMALELGILSDLQVGELMFKENELTLSWDSTPLDGQKINSCHISSKHQNLTLQTFGMPGGTTEDYLEHILNAIHDIGCQYSTYHGIQQHVVLYTLFQSLQATLTDRAKVNKCVNDKLEEMVDRKLVQLKCFLHPLDGMASEARKELKKLDVDWSVSTSLYGHEGSTANLVHALSKLRYKENSRDPKGFKAYLLREGLKKTYIPRYVGNKLHVLFLLAVIIYKIKDSLAVYLEKFCKSMKLREAIEKDLTNPDVMVQIRVLGLFGKLLTGPWMKLFYNKSSGLRELSHLEMRDLTAFLCLSDMTGMLMGKIKCLMER